MKNILVLLIMITLTKLCSQDAPGPGKITYRPATVAGTFYPADPDELRTTINGFLSRGNEDYSDKEIYGLVVPHAGYVFSGWNAGMSYRKVQGRDYDAVIILAPCHVKAFRGASVFDGDAYVTPLGYVEVDKELVKVIGSEHELVNISRNGHEWTGDRSEHSLEVQIPFIQVVLPGIPIISIVMGTQDNQTTNALFKAIVKAVKKTGKKVLMIASSDLSHYHDAKTAELIDGKIIKSFERYDYFRIALNCFSRRWEACGAGPVAVAMMVAEELGANKAKKIMYSHSGNSPYIKMDKKSVVGYLSGIMFQDDTENKLLPNLSEDSRRKIVNMAKQTVINKTLGKEEKNILIPEDKELSDEYAVFVTLHKHGKLRGCMGHTIAEKTLAEEVIESAKLACSHDPRFSPVEPSELDDLDYDVTILSRMKRVLDIEDVEPGRDGVLLRNGYNSGIFLPQVATEQQWERKTLLEQLGRKAGLSKNAYLDPDSELYIFRGMILK
jgi:MEMO1 family protein